MQRLSRRPALLVLAFAGFVLALVWGTVVALVVSDRTQTFDDARREMAGGQRVLRAHAQRTFETAETQLMALDLWMSQASRMPLHNGLENLAEAFEQFHIALEDPLRVRLVGNDLRLIPFGPFGNDNVSVGDREYVQEVMKLPPGQYHVGMPIVARDSAST